MIGKEEIMPSRGKPRAYSAEAFKKKVEEYFRKGGRPIKDTGIKLYTLSGLCLYLGIHRDTFADYARRAEYSDTIKKAREEVENCIEELSLIGVIEKTSAIFNLKNNFGWKDKDREEDKPKEENQHVIIKFTGAPSDE